MFVFVAVTIIIVVVLFEFVFAFVCLFVVVVLLMLFFMRVFCVLFYRGVCDGCEQLCYVYNYFLRVESIFYFFLFCQSVLFSIIKSKSLEVHLSSYSSLLF